MSSPSQLSSVSALPAPIRPLATTFAYYAAFIGLGLVSASLGPTLPGLAEQTRSDIGGISFLFTTRATGYMLGSLLGGRLYDRLTGHPVMAAALLVMAVGMVAVPMLPLLWTLALVLLFVGIAEGTLDVGGNTLIVWVHRSRVGPYMNALHFFFGLGAFISPLIIAWVFATVGGIRAAYWVLAVSVLPLALWLLRLPSPANIHVADVAGGRRVVTNWRLMGLIVVFLFFFVGA